MLLARGLLAWLPLGHFLPLRSEAPERKWMTDEQTILFRAELVNGLTREESQEVLLRGGLPRLGSQSGSPVNLDLFDRYVQLCTFQGELSPLAPIFLPRAGLLDRALFLRRPNEYCLLSDLGPLKLKETQVLEGLALQDPEVIVRILSRPENQLLHPGNVAWTPELRALYRWLLNGRDPRGFRGREHFEFLLLAGYVGAENLAGRVSGYQQGQLLWASREKLPPLAWAEELLQGENSQLADLFLAEVGYPQPEISLENRITLALSEIEPQSLRGFDLSGADYSQINLSLEVTAIYPVLVQKAAQLLDWLPAQPVGASSQYRYVYLMLQILCGRPVDEKDLRRKYNRQLSQLMLAVCHPQLSQENVNYGFSAIQSTVHYDLENFLKLSPGPSPDVPNTLRLLLRYGLLYRYLRRYPDFGRRVSWQPPLELLEIGLPHRLQSYGGEISGLLVLMARKYGRVSPNPIRIGCQSLVGLEMLVAAYSHYISGYEEIRKRIQAEEQRRRQLLQFFQ